MDLSPMQSSSTSSSAFPSTTSDSLMGRSPASRTPCATPDSSIAPPPSYHAALLSSLQQYQLLTDQLMAQTFLVQSNLMGCDLTPPLFPIYPSSSLNNNSSAKAGMSNRASLQPVDLSMKSYPLSAGLCEPSTSTQQSARPSVILDTNSLRRSSSSVGSSTKPEWEQRSNVKRSHSGKWPHRVNASEDRRASPFTRRPPSAAGSSPTTGSSSSSSNNNVILITSKADHNESIEEHFRRALGVEDFERWKKNRAAAAEEKRKRLPH